MGRPIGKYVKMTQSKVDESVRLYKLGLSAGSVATTMGISRSAMYQLLRSRTTMRSNLRYGSDNHFYRGGSRADDSVHDKLEYAIRIGSIERKTNCESCGVEGHMADGRTVVQAHHDDYNKPLDVRWLCQICHHEWHMNNVPIERDLAPSNSAYG